MTHRLAAGAVLALTLLGVTPRGAEACSCVSMSPCQGLSLPGRTLNVFEATVVSIERHPREHGLVNGEMIISDGTTTVRLKDVKALLGESAAVVTTSGSGASCGYAFKVGERYVIDATPGRDGLSTSACSQTKPIAQAVPLLEYVASLSKPSPGGLVTGTVTMSNMTMLAMTALDSARAGLTVTAEGPITQSTTTRSDGSFTFPPLPAGSYRLRIDLPAAGPFAVARERAFTLGGAHACHDAHSALRLDATISGTVVDRDSKPIPKARMLLRTETPPDAGAPGRYAWATSDEFGQYQFEGIPPGRYVVGLNLDSGPRHDSPYLPAFIADASGRPEVVDLPLGGHVELPPLVAVAPTNVVVAGRVAWPDGKPGAGLMVSASGRGETRFSNGTHHRVTADADGRFSFTLAADVRYEVRAFADPNKAGAPDYGIVAEAQIIAGSSPISLLLRRQR